MVTGLVVVRMGERGAAPDPLEARSVAEFVGRLRLLKVWAGDPSFERLARLSGVPRSTLADALSVRRGRPPRLDVVRRLVRACGIDDEGVAGWEGAWRLLAAAAADRPSASGSSPTPSPALLPADVADFSGRDEQAAELGRLLVTGADTAVGSARLAPVVAVITGRGGVGKTALAVHVAHLLAETFPDGQLYVDLRGADPDPADPGLVLGRFLRALGVERAALPAGLEERAELYRGLLAGRRVLVVLDNAASAAQLRPLLPGTSTCAVLVTSRSRPAELGGARCLDIDVLDSNGAVHLLAAVTGTDRVATEPDAAAEVARLCGYLPLALRIAGARLVARPHWSLARLAGRLADERGRLDELAVGDLDVRGSLTLSYRALEFAAARAFRLLALLDAPDFAAWVAGALLDADPEQAEDLVDALVDARLLDVSGDGPGGRVRYRFHDLVRLFGRERAEAEDPEFDRRAALTRAFGGWLALAERADARLPARERPPIHGSAPRWPLPAGVLRDVSTDPVALLDAERAALAAAVAQAARMGHDEYAWDLAASSGNLFDLRGYYDDAMRIHRLALDACLRTGNRLGEAVSLLGLSLVPSDGRVTADQCLAWTNRAAELFHQVGEAHGEAKALELAAYLHGPRGRLDEASRSIATGLSICRAKGCRDVEAYLWYDRGLAHSVRGDHLVAEASFTTALRLSRRHGLRLIEAGAQLALGSQHGRRGEMSAARACLEQSLAIAEEIGHTSLRAIALSKLAQSYVDLGHPDAEAAVDRSLECSHRFSIAYAQTLALAALGGLRLAEGRAAAAAAACDKAHGLVGGLGAPFQQALVLTSLGRLHRMAGRHGRATSAWREARRCFAAIGNLTEAEELDALIAERADIAENAENAER